jgi:type I restriction enzyme S subunit
MSEWREYKLGDLFDVKGGKRLPKGDLLVDYETNHPYIRVTDLSSKWITKQGLQFVTKEIQKSISRYIVNKDDVILSIVGSIGFTGIISNELDGANLTENCVKFVQKSKGINNHFLYYFLKSPNGQEEIEKRNVGSTQPKLPIYNIKDIPILIPPLPEQKAIAAVLSSLDDKIDLLHRQNKTLEAMAETLFRQWFVVETQEDWEEKPLKDVVDIGIGRTPPRQQHQWFSTNSTDIKWISIKDMGVDGAYIFQTSEYLTQAAVEQFNIPVIPKNTVVLSFKMTVGRVAITTETMLSNEAIAHFKFNQQTPFSQEYLYLFLKGFKYELLGSTSSIVTSINSAMIKDMLITVPDENTMRQFAESTKLQFCKIRDNQKQIRTLETLRDTLLPKLMSGEVRVTV